MAERRRDPDPVKVGPRASGGFRVRYWDYGSPGEGVRREERHATRELAEARAVEIREALALGPGPVVKAGVTLREVVRLWIQGLPESTNKNSKKAWRSDMNVSILPVAGSVAVRSLGVLQYAAILDGVVARGRSRNTLEGVIRTLGSFTSWAELRGHLPADAFGTPVQIKAVKKRARQQLGKASALIRREDCPAPADVAKLAAELELLWPGKGSNLVLILAASGLRISEVLAVKASDVDLGRCSITVARQADRLAAWPAVTPPKHRSWADPAREAMVWRHALPELTAAVLAADEADGWLFPPDEGLAEMAGLLRWVEVVSKRLGEAQGAAGWPDRWGTHWLRHHYASYSLAPPPAGFGLPLGLVSGSLGHSKQSFTLDTYSQPVSDPAATMAALTSDALPA
jgi:integrase